nr:hypothetical protein [uncultured Sphingobacterium sp.]
MLRLWPDLEMLYSHRLLSTRHLELGQIPWSISIIQTGQPYIFAVLYILSGIFMCFHRRTFLPTLSLFILHYSFFIGNNVWSYGVDYLAQTGLFFSLLFGGRQALHIKRRRLTNLGAALFRLQLTFVYFFAGLGKVYGETWWNGEAVWKAIQQPFTGTLLPIPITAYRFEYVWILLGILTILMELCYPLVWIKKIFRPLIISGIILMHIGIALSMGLLHFSLLMIWYNYCAWGLPYLRIAKSITQKLESKRNKTTGVFDLFRFNTRKGGIE